jgi:hypothetical protein
MFPFANSITPAPIPSTTSLKHGRQHEAGHYLQVATRIEHCGEGGLAMALNLPRPAKQDSSRIARRAEGV